MATPELKPGTRVRALEHEDFTEGVIVTPDQIGLAHMEDGESLAVFYADDDQNQHYVRTKAVDDGDYYVLVEVIDE